MFLVQLLLFAVTWSSVLKKNNKNAARVQYFISYEVPGTGILYHIDFCSHEIFETVRNALLVSKTGELQPHGLAIPVQPRHVCWLWLPMSISAPLPNPTLHRGTFEKRDGGCITSSFNGWNPVVAGGGMAPQ
jgi:hypothetical protein